MKNSLPSWVSLLVLAGCIAGPHRLMAQSNDTVSVILVDGDMREDWPRPGVVAFHREGTSGDLPVNFSVTGNAVAGSDYTLSATESITIPDGNRETWLEIAPTGATLHPATKSVLVTGLPGTGYVLSSTNGLSSAAITIGTPSNVPSDKAAVRFLLQAAFGPDGNFANVKDVERLGYSGWLNAQFAKPVGRIQPYLDKINAATHGRVYSDAKAVSWWNEVMNHAATADPLRQRIGFALSEMFVISDHLDELGNAPIGMANYYDMLLANAFGNYRDLLFNVGMHPAMGVYLSAMQNEKGNPALGTFADENYAREVMQLFSIGIWQLNPDGTQTLDGNGQPIPTYDNTTIANMARVMTGFSWGGPKGTDFWWAPENFEAPMRMWDAYHDLDPKTIIAGIQLPARTASNPDVGTAGLLDYNAAVNALFNHPNCPPFVSKQLIQKLVTSNPSPAYVQRVANVFINNGNGVRGDMKAVIRAILLDPEARDPAMMSDPVFGKMKEPYIRTANLMKALDARAGNGVYELSYLDDIHYEQPLSAPSVFNFYKPGYSPGGTISNAGLVAPEFQILNAVTALAVPTYHFEALMYGFNRWGSNRRAALVMPDILPEFLLSEDVPALMRHLDLLMTGGTLPNAQHEIIREAVEKIQPGMWRWREERVRMAIYLIAGAPEYGILR
jgi:uncharacterized protein (DUF1800 family)